jgi:hypothetical protein
MPKHVDSIEGERYSKQDALLSQNMTAVVINVEELTS